MKDCHNYLRFTIKVKKQRWLGMGSRSWTGRKSSFRLRLYSSTYMHLQAQGSLLIENVHRNPSIPQAAVQTAFRSQGGRRRTPCALRRPRRPTNPVTSFKSKYWHRRPLQRPPALIVQSSQTQLHNHIKSHQLPILTQAKPFWICASK